MNTRLGVVLLSAAALASSAAAPGPGAEGQTPPLDSTVTEQVEVRLVLIDALVVDRAGRIVPDLGVEDFELLLGHRPHPIDTLDVFCPAGAAAEPKAVERLDERAAPVAPGVGRRIVIAVDYMHLAQTRRPDALRNLRATVRHGASPDDEIMVAAITDTLRIEQGFTRDHDAVVATLERMEHDITLWQPPFDHEHELRYFNNLIDLVELLGEIPGSKAVMLVSNLGGTRSDYDPQFRRIAARAAEGRVALYPVLQIGMAPFSAAPRLARLAVDTGGRFTEGTNDLSLAFARAQRDLACRYTIGFYDRGPVGDRPRQVTLRVKRPGLRAIHPQSYGARTPEEQAASRRRSALHAPELFAAAGVEARFIALGPRGPRRWEGLLALRFPLTLAPGEEAIRELAVRARRGNTTRHRAEQTLTIRRRDPAPWQGEVTVLHPVALKPGSYGASAVLGQPGIAEPRAAGDRFELARVPRGELFVVGPVLGRDADAAIELRGEPGEKRPQEAWLAGFEPLLGLRVDRASAPLALTRICFVGPADSAPTGRLLRDLERIGGPAVESWPEHPFELEQVDGARCATFRDRLGESALASGTYRFRVTVEPRPPGETIERSVEFAVVAGAAAPGV